MEIQNIYKVIKSVLSISIFTFTLCLFSQDYYIINKFEGMPYLEVNDSIKSIVNGMPIKKNAVLTLNENDNVHFINKDGSEFVIGEAGNYSYDKLLQVPAIETNKPYVKKFLVYVWEQFTNNVTDTRSRSGVVYRGDDILLMQFPVDSAKVFGSELQFRWHKIENKEKDYYLVLRNIETGKKTIIGTPATYLTLLVDNTILETGQSYEWAITETKYPNLNKTEFYRFDLISEVDFKALNKELKSITTYLKQQGLNVAEIQTALCEVYKICY